MKPQIRKNLGLHHFEFWKQDFECKELAAPGGAGEFVSGHETSVPLLRVTPPETDIVVYLRISYAMYSFFCITFEF